MFLVLVSFLPALILCLNKYVVRSPAQRYVLAFSVPLETRCVLLLGALKTSGRRCAGDGDWALWPA